MLETYGRIIRCAGQDAGIPSGLRFRCAAWRQGSGMLDWHELLPKSNDELAKYDVAAVNLACAAGLPGSERIDFDGCLRTLDAWAGVVRRWTDAAYLDIFLRNLAK